jgi:hypothetical protein
MTTTRAMHNATWSRQDETNFHWDIRSGAADCPTSSHKSADAEPFDTADLKDFEVPLMDRPLPWDEIKDIMILGSISGDNEVSSMLSSVSFGKDFDSDEEESSSDDESSDPLITMFLLQRGDSMKKIAGRGRRVVMTRPNKVHEDKKLLTRSLKRSVNSSSKNHGNIRRAQGTVEDCSPNNSSQNPFMNSLKKSDSLRRIEGRGTRIILSTLPAKIIARSA